MNNDGAKRIYYLDYLRVLAIISIVVGHNATPYFWGNIDSSQWKAVNIYETVLRPFLPVFLMISGSLFLNRQIPIKKIYSKYVVKMLVAVVAWSLFYAIVAPDPSLGFVTQFAQGFYHLWFMKLMILIYLLLPLIKRLADNKRASMVYLIVAGIIFTLGQGISILHDFVSVSAVETNPVLNFIYYFRDSALMQMIGYVGYFMLGHHLAKMEPVKKIRVSIYALALLSFAFTYKAQYVVAFGAQGPSENYYGPFMLNIFFPSVALFLFFKNLELDGNSFIQQLSKISFGVYLIHPIVIIWLEKYFGIRSVMINPLFGILLVGILTAAIAFVFSYILSRIPVVNKYLV